MRGALRDARLTVRREPHGGWGLVDASGSCARLLGADPAALLRAFGDEISPLFGAADHSAVAAALSSALSGQTQSLEVGLVLEGVSEDGADMPARADFLPIASDEGGRSESEGGDNDDEGGDCVTVVLSQSSGRARGGGGHAALFQMLSEMTDGVVRVDGESLRVLEASDGFARLTELGAEPSAGLPLSRFLRRADEDKLRDELRDCRAALGSFRCASALITATGELVPVSLRGTREDASAFCLCFARDLPAASAKGAAAAGARAAGDAKLSPPSAAPTPGDTTEPCTPHGSPRLQMRKATIPLMAAEAAAAIVDQAAKRIDLRSPSTSPRPGGRPIRPLSSA